MRGCCLSVAVGRCRARLIVVGGRWARSVVVVGFERCWFCERVVVGRRRPRCRCGSMFDIACWRVLVDVVWCGRLPVGFDCCRLALAGAGHRWLLLLLFIVC